MDLRPLTAADILHNEKISTEGVLLGPITDPSIVLLHSKEGVGKTLFVHEVAYGIATGDCSFTRNPIPAWKPCTSPGDVLIVDGEMPLGALKTRISEGARGRSLERVHIISMMEHYNRTGESIDISLPEHRTAIDKKLTSLKRPKLLILDNLTSLTGDTYSEDASADQRGLNNWFTSLREKGISVLLVHHDNKSGDQRGSSARTAPVNLTIHLIKPPEIPVYEARYNVTFTKSRNAWPQPKPFALKYVNGVFAFRSYEDSRIDELLEIMELTGKWSYRDVMVEMGLSRSRVFALRDETRRHGLWRKEWDKVD